MRGLNFFVLLGVNFRFDRVHFFAGRGNAYHQLRVNFSISKFREEKERGFRS